MTTFDGMLRILRYNWPTYVLAALSCAAFSALRRQFTLPAGVRALLAAGIGLAAYWSFASLLVSHFVYDRSQLTDWSSWLPHVLARSPARVLNVHVGVDEVGPNLQQLFPGSETRSIDVFDPSTVRSGSVRRARALADVAAGHPDRRALPFTDHTWNAVLLIFVAHEFRDRASLLALFRELRRVLAPDGQLLLVEHARDVPNFLAFGPGFLHFLPPRAWPAAANDAGLRITAARKVTPFVTAMVLERSTP